MNTNISPLAGQPAQAMQLVDVTKLVAAYYNLQPNPRVPAVSHAILVYNRDREAGLSDGVVESTTH